MKDEQLVSKLKFSSSQKYSRHSLLFLPKISAKLCQWQFIVLWLIIFVAALESANASNYKLLKLFYNTWLVIQIDYICSTCFYHSKQINLSALAISFKLLCGLLLAVQPRLTAMDFHFSYSRTGDQKKKIILIRRTKVSLRS